MSQPRALTLPKPEAFKILEPEHLKATADVLEAYDKLPERIATDYDVLAVQEVMRRASALAERVDEIRLAYKKPVDALVKTIQDQAKKVTTPMAETVFACKEKLRQKTIADRNAAEFRAIQEMAKAEKDGRATPDLTRVIAPNNPWKPKIPVRETQVATVTDESLLPDEYWIPNMDLIRSRVIGPAAISIPGVTVSTEVSVVNR